MIKLTSRLPRVAVLACAAGLALASGAAWLARDWWVFDLASQFRLQYCIGFAAILVALAGLRCWGWLLALAPLAVANALPLLPYIPGPNAAASGSGARLTLVNVNLLVSNRNSEGLVDTLLASHPDVIVLDEFSRRWRKALAALEPLYPHRISVPDAGPYGIALYSRLPLSGARSFLLGRAPAIEAGVEIAGKRVQLVGVHLRSPISARRAAERNEQFRELTRLATSADAPLVVLGDFNSTPFSPYFSAWLADSLLEDSARGRGLKLTWPTFLPMLRIPIDHCVVSKDFEVLATERLPAFGSDHFPLLTVLALKEPEEPVR